MRNELPESDSFSSGPWTSIPESSWSHISSPTSIYVHHLLLINLLCLLAYHAACLEVRGQFYGVDLSPFHWFQAKTPVASLAWQALY